MRNGGSDGDAGEPPTGSGVADEVPGSKDEAGVSDGVGLAVGVGLVADPQATTRRATTMAAKRASDERIRCFPWAACSKETLGRLICCARSPVGVPTLPNGTLRASR